MFFTHYHPRRAILFRILPIAPDCDLSDQLFRQRFGVGQPDRPLAHIIIRKSVRKKNCRFTARIQSQMLFRRCEVDDIPSFPICWHAPRNFLLCFRQSRAKDLTHLVQIRSGIFILFFNVLIDGFDLTAVMVLAFAAETPTAFGAFLHSSEPPCA